MCENDYPKNPFKPNPRSVALVEETEPCNWEETANPFGLLVRAKVSEEPIGEDVRGGHYMNDEGFPTGGYATATGMLVAFQDGPTKAGEQCYVKNGAFVEDLLIAAKSRLEFYQTSDKVKCEENRAAIIAIEAALTVLGVRRSRRIAAGKYGTNEM